MDEIYKEVYFNKFCNKCIHKDVNTNDEDDSKCQPCHDCLNEPSNMYSHRPKYWEAK